MPRSPLGLLVLMGLFLGMPRWSTAEQPGDRERSVFVNVVAYGTNAAGENVGSCDRVRVTAGGNHGDSVRVGFFETEVGGTGPQWRAAGWMAAVNAALLTDFNPRAMRVSFEFEGKVDGPSAGALMTCGALAAIRGDQVREDVAMTGTINPDGSVGPVGGIVHKIEGAAAKGMKLMLIPAGIRFDRDRNSGEDTDLIEYGEKLGIEVRNVFDIYQAYKLVTGVELPRSPAAGSPRVNLATQKIVKEKIKVWYNHYSHALTAYSEMPGNAKLAQEVVDLYKRGVEIIAHSEQLINEGEFTAAMWDRVMAAACGYLALEVGRCRQTYATGGYEGLIERLRTNDWLEKEVQAVAKRMREETPRNLDQLSMYLVACDTFLEGVSLQALAKEKLDSLPEEESDAAINIAGNAAAEQIMAWLDLKLTGDYLDLAVDNDSAPIPQQVPWRQTADYLNRAGSASLAVFDSLIVEPGAKSQGVSADVVRGRLMQQDKSYAIVNGAYRFVFPRLREYFGDGDPLGYAYLSSSIYVHTRTAGLLAKHYSLGAELNDFGAVVKMSKERTLGEWLTYAEDQSRRNISLLQERGVASTPCALMHEVARIKARRDVSEKMEGLVQFWAADVHAQVLRRVSGWEKQAAEKPADHDSAPAAEKGN